MVSVDSSRSGIQTLPLSRRLLMSSISNQVCFTTYPRKLCRVLTTRVNSIVRNSSPRLQAFPRPTQYLILRTKSWSLVDTRCDRPTFPADMTYQDTKVIGSLPPHTFSVLLTVGNSHALLSARSRPDREPALGPCTSRCPMATVPSGHTPRPVLRLRQRCRTRVPTAR